MHVRYTPLTDMAASLALEQDLQRIEELCWGTIHIKCLFFPPGVAITLRSGDGLLASWRDTSIRQLAVEVNNRLVNSSGEPFFGECTEEEAGE